MRAILCPFRFSHRHSRVCTSPYLRPLRTTLLICWSTTFGDSVCHAGPRFLSDSVSFVPALRTLRLRLLSVVLLTGPWATVINPGSQACDKVRTLFDNFWRQWRTALVGVVGAGVTIKVQRKAVFEERLSATEGYKRRGSLCSTEPSEACCILTSDHMNTSRLRRGFPEPGQTILLPKMSRGFRLTYLTII